MKLGILVNTNNHLPALAGIVKAADAKGHQVVLFAMDEGAFLLEQAEFTALAELDNVTMSFCDHSTKELGVNTEGLAENIERSSQYSNAAMNHNADKVLVL